MKAGPKQSKTVPAVYNHIGISETKSHAKMASYTKGLIIPKSERTSTLKVLQMGHYAVDKMSLRARETVYWPGISEDIRNTYHHCHICAKFTRTQQRETRQYIETPQTAWEQLGLDIFTLKNTQYLLVIDYFSWFPVVKQLQSLHSLSVIKHLKDIFTEIGIPRCIVSDGGTQFTSQEFQDFTRTWGIHHQQMHSQMDRQNVLCKL